MNILILTHSYPEESNSWRGSFIRDQARALSSENKVIVLFFKTDYEHFAPFAKPHCTKLQNGNLTEYTIVVCKSFPVINQVNYLLKTYRSIKREIFPVFIPDIIHCHLTYPAGFLGIIMHKIQNIPVFITEHSRITNYYRSSIHRRIVEYSLKNASCIIAVSNSLKNEILPFTNKPVAVIPNIVDTEKFRTIRKETSQILNIGFLGSLASNNKGLDILLNSVSQLKKGSFMLHIGGKGALLQEYKQTALKLGIDASCIFYGGIEHEMIGDFFYGIDLFVLPSRYETFGVVLVEAMACGIPVISTRCGGPEDIVTESTGILIEKNNPAELTSALEFMSANLKSFEKEAIRKYAEENFGIRSFVRHISQLYNEILK
jgi:L-malate glycosyltransferase